MASTLVVAGGRTDPNLDALTRAALADSVEVIELRVGPDDCPRFTWDLGTGSVELDGRRFDAGAAFIRYDVFSAMQDPRPEVVRRAGAWHDVVAGWLLAHPDVRSFNRALPPEAINKPFQLVLARALGLRVPSTMLTNDLARLEGLPQDRQIVKPVSGGDYCVTLAEATRTTSRRLDVAPAPALVQPRIPAPEIRIYVVGADAFAFELLSDAVDYRADQVVTVRECPAVPPEAEGVRRLMNALGMNFGAADLRTDADTGDLVFLELNTSPMFARFDAESGGRLCSAMVRELQCDEIVPVQSGGELWRKHACMPV